MSQQFFITGTDTEVGKTYIACELLRCAREQGLQAIGMKPIASGAVITQSGLRNEDALSLQKSASDFIPYEVVNPYVFEPAIAPHIAAAQVQCELSVAKLTKSYADFSKHAHDVAVVEGAGGWFVPLSYKETLADFVATQGLKVILVVGMRLGCINHTLLTVRAIESMGLTLCGWVANTPTKESMSNYDQNMSTISAMLDAPLLAEVKFGENLQLMQNPYLN